ncbi:hypothetical protein [Pseudonocardia acaciae]|uniref:hypothetical protein n=1 Tax=Pseudonocardia acaciae TaxID=551276 RepID=UPI00048FF83A|nr:hypothetical protein [Pseudonocardia acaciae]
MRWYLMNAPAWVLSVITGLAFGLLMTIAFALLSSAIWNTPATSLTFDIVAGAIGGLIFGAVMGPFAAMRYRHVRSVLGPLSAEDLAVVLRAVARGPVPADPELRQAAGRLARLKLDDLRRNRVWTTLIFVLFLLLEVREAVVTSPWFWLAAVLFAYFILLQLWLPRRLRRRIERLGAYDGERRGPVG